MISSKVKVCIQLTLYVLLALFFVDDGYAQRDPVLKNLRAQYSEFKRRLSQTESQGYDVSPVIPYFQLIRPAVKYNKPV